MMLDSGDILCMDVTPTHTILQFLQWCDPDKGEVKENDVVTLNGAATARLIWAMRQAGRGVEITSPQIKGGGKGSLYVSSRDKLFTLHGYENCATLTLPELYMALCVLTTRAWRLFT